MAIVLILTVLAAPYVQAGITVKVMGVDHRTQSISELAGYNYRWLVEEDKTFFSDPDAVLPDVNPAALGLNFHASYMPVAAKGNTANAESPAAASLKPDTQYFISVLPNTSEDYAMSGTSFRTDAAGNATATVYLNKLPLPTAQIRIFVFHDNQPINNAPDLPQEQGLAGFQIILEEPAGRYGASGGQVQRDVYGNPLGTTYDADGNILVLGDGVITTNANGIAVVKNLAPGKYGVLIDPPETQPGQEWIQTSTIEGTKVIDAWVKANEPAYFTEFGPPGPHVSFGFVKEFTDTNVLTGGVTVSGQVANIHYSRPPDYSFYNGDVFPDAYVGLNDMSVGRGVGVYVAKTTGESEFSIPNVPPGDYQLVVWDKNLDIIFASAAFRVNPDGATCSSPYDDCNFGKVGVFDWFAHLRGRVFYDMDEDGFPDPGEGSFGPAMPVSIRWRDGTVFQVTDNVPNAGYQFDEVFPFFSWLVAEVDFGGPYKATGATIVVDAGGPVNPPDAPLFDPNNEFAYPSYNRLTPQVQNAVNEHTGNSLSRTEKGEVLTQAFQGFLGQTSVIHWGKTVYNTGIGENGGISGVVVYKTTRAEPSPEDDVAQNWEPGIPRVQVNLYQFDEAGQASIKDINGVPGTQFADVDNYPFGWSDGAGPKGPEDVENSGNDGVWDKGDAVAVTWSDSWDDNQPTDCPGDPGDPFYSDGKCYDGLRNFNQVRPGVYDGGYMFPGFNSNNPDGIRSGVYVVEAVPPPNYQIVKSQDMNVVFGDTFTPSLLAFPFVPACVGEEYEAPQELALFSGVLHPYYDPESPLYRGGAPVTLNACDRKYVQLVPGVNRAVDFFLFTEVPIAAHVVGFILNDLANEFDPNNPNFGEKQALGRAPVSFRDWTGREITRVYADQYGNYNALLPSTINTNLPVPSGMSPNMLTACMNDPGPIPNPDYDPVSNPDAPQFITDPHFNPQYTQFCYTLQYMPGATTFLDTPVEPIAAFAGQNQQPLDCEFKDGVPVIRSARGTVGSKQYVGPYVERGGLLTLTSVGTKAVVDPSGANAFVDRDYGFGPTRGALGAVAINNVSLPVLSWSNSSITVRIPNRAQTGQLMVRRSNGQVSMNGLTVTVGPIAPRQVIEVQPASGLGGISRWPDQPIQQAIEAAAPGDLILIGEGAYEELVIMWKPVQLQGAGANAVTINAVKAPGEKLQAWRDKVTDLFAANSVTALPGQVIAPDPNALEPGLLGSAEGPPIMVLAKNSGTLNNNGFVANPNARIDGLMISGSDIAGGIYVNGYARYLEISNNRIINNAGINGGGIVIGHPDLIANDLPVDADNDNLNIHHNQIMENGSRISGGGGVAIYTGADDYLISDCWICGNYSKSSGGGIGQSGLVADRNRDSFGGIIRDNNIIFNQVFDQTAGSRPSGGGIGIEGFAPPAAADVLTPGSGSVAIDGNLIHGNIAGAGDGGGIELFATSGQDVAQNPTNILAWHRITVTNNMITNNLAGKAGGGISLRDTAFGVIVNNTIANNDSTATAGDLVTPASPGIAGALSEPQPAGVVSYAHSPQLTAAVGTAFGRTFSDPVMANNIIWHNRSFHWAVDVNGVGSLVQDSPPYRDLEVLPNAVGTLECENCVTSIDGDPAFDSSYFNTNGSLTIIPENQTPLTSAAVDEGGNFIDVRFGPLTLWNPATGGLFGSYHLLSGSPAIDAGTLTVANPLNPASRINLYPNVPTLLFDFDGDRRPNPNTNRVDIGADERY